MSTPQSRVQDQLCPVVHGSPIDSDDPRVLLHSPQFAADPHRFYREMRRKYGSLAPVELAPGVPATLVIGYETAVRVLHDPERFPANPRTWQQTVPADCAIRPLLEWRPNACKSAGSDFVRYREAIVASINSVDLYAFHGIVEETAIPLVNSFCQDGAADLIRQYVFPLMFEVANVLIGCTPEIGQRLTAGIGAILDGADSDVGNTMMFEALLELVALKRADPGDDVTSVLLQHPARLDDLEMVHNLTAVYGPGIEFLLNLITNTLLLILTDDRFGGSVLGGNLSTREALDEVLFNDPPVANFLITYPRQPILIDDVWLPAHQPVVTSMAACNNDPAIRTDDLTGNRSHLAWGVGPHACPAQSLAYLIAQDAIDQLLDALPDMRPNLPNGTPAWRPGPFHRALTALPVTFPATSPLNTNNKPTHLR